MDCLDPRMFLILPEHVSNAHHVWNYALIITQMSNSAAAAASNSQSSLSLTHTNKSQSNQDSSINASLNKIINNSNNYTFSFESIINDFKTPNSLNEFNNLLLDEPIQRILKIKKRNKASLYNLIFSKNLNDNQISLTELNNLTTPWMLLKAPPAQPSIQQSHSNIATNSTTSTTLITNNNLDKSDNESVVSNDEKTTNNSNNSNNNTSLNNNNNNNVSSSSSSSSSSSNSEAEIDLNNFDDGCRR